MKNSGVEIYVFRGSEKSKKMNPLFRNLKEISTEKGTRLDLGKEGDSGTHGLFVAPGSLFSDLEKPTIFIHEEAETYSLIHEYLHYLFWKESKEQRADVEFLMYREKRSLTKNFENIYADREKLLNQLWRRDIVNSLLSYGESLKLGISQVLVEEYLIEKTLGEILKKDRSPHWDQERETLGAKYGLMNLKKAESEISRLKAQRSFIESELAQLEAPQDGWKEKLQQLDQIIESIEIEIQRIPEYKLIAT
jgi:hypothetical protein